MARKQRPLKTHFFDDCPNTYPNGDDAPYTTDVKRVSCGACKRKILHRIADADWNTLTITYPQLENVLKLEAQIAKSV